MADDGNSTKRPNAKTAEDDRIIAELRRRNAELEFEIEQRRGRQDELESEIEKLRSYRRRGGRREGHHEVLPVVTEVIVNTAVDLSRLDTSLVNQVSSFLGTARELLNLALTCKSFGRPDPETALNWSLVEEVARQIVRSRATDAEMSISILPRYDSSCTVTWLSILHRFEHPLLFDVLLGRYVEYLNRDKTKVCGTYGRGYQGGSSTAVSSGHVMSCGSHFAEFQITGTPTIGIVRPMPGLDAGAYRDGFTFIGASFLYPDFLERRSDEWGSSNVHACGYGSETGYRCWTDWDDEVGGTLWSHWEGMESCTTGDTIGMLLNLDEGTLIVYKNNRHLGVMKDGLSGSYCWYAGVEVSETVTIKDAQIP